MVYFDHNATTALDENVLEAMLPFLTGASGNPSSVHRLGRFARAAIDQAREQVAALVNANAAEVVFTSGGTEANNLMLSGYTANVAQQQFIVSAIEHACVVEPAERLAAIGWQVDKAPVGNDCLIQQDWLKLHLTPKTRFLSVMAANNETGVIQNIAEIAALAAEAQVPIHTDAAQAAGKIPVDFKAWGVQAMTLSAHKIHGPQGAGALIKDKSLDLSPVQMGGSQELGLRAGTENVAAIVGFGMAAEIAHSQLADRASTALQLRQQLEQGLSQIEDIVVFAQDAQRLPNTVQFAHPSMTGETLLMMLDKQGFAVSSGSACNSGNGKPSHVLKAMDVDDALALGAIRVSLGVGNTQQEVNEFIAALKQCLNLNH